MGIGSRATGGAYVSVLLVPRKAVTITGEVKYYDVKGDSGNILSRGFCPTCGSRLFGRPAVMSEVMGILAGSLDDPCPWKFRYAGGLPLVYRDGKCFLRGLFREVEISANHSDQGCDNPPPISAVHFFDCGCGIGRHASL